MTARIGITGATGYLGSALVRDLGQDGHEVIRFVRKPEGSGDRSFVLGSAMDPVALTDIEVLIHAAYDMRLTAEAEIWRVNVEGTKKMLEAAAQAGVGKVIVLSSMSAYPGTWQLYGRAKLDIEAASRDHGAIVVRPGIVVSRGAGGMAGALARLVRMPVTPYIVGAGNQFPITEADFVTGVRLLVQEPASDIGPLGLASSQAVSFKDLLRLISRLTGARPPRLVPVPHQAVELVLRAGERMGVAMPFRSDSLLGLLRPAPFVPNVDYWSKFGFEPGFTRT